MVALNPWYLSKSCASIANVLYLVPLTRALYIRETPATTWLSITHDHSPLAFTIEPLWLLGSTSVSISEKRSWRFAPWWLWFPAGTHSSTDLLGCRSTFDCEKSRFLADAESIYIYAWNVCVCIYYIILYYVILYYIILYYIILYHIISYHVILYYIIL